MTINPGALLLAVIGIVAVIVGVRGSQSQTWAALFGRPSAPATSTSSSSSAPGSGATPPATRLA